MKGTRILLSLALLFVLLLAGCKSYSKGDEDAVRRKGEQMMRDWLENAYHGVELVSATPFVARDPSGDSLTDFVYGTFRYRGEEQAYWLDTASGAVYFEQSGESARELSELCGAYAAEALGLGDGCAIDAAGASVDVGVRQPSGARPAVLPAEFVLSGTSLESYVRSPEARPPLVFTVSFRVPDAFDVSGVTLAEARRALDERGLLIEYAAVENGSESLTLRGDRAAYQRMGFADLPDFRVWMPVYEREETVDRKTGRVAARVTERDASRDLAVERAADGFYRPKFPNGWFPAVVYAYDGSEMLRHEYCYVSDNNMVVDLAWTKTERGWSLGDTPLSESHPFTEKK